MACVCKASRAGASDEGLTFQAFIATASAGRLASCVEGITAQAQPDIAMARRPCRDGAVALSAGQTGLLDTACGSCRQAS